MPPILTVGGYYSSPTKNIGEKGAFSSIIDGISNLIATYWIYFSILFFILLLILAYYIYRKIKRKLEDDSSGDSSQPIPDAF